MSWADDAVILTILRALSPGVNVHDSDVKDSDPTDNIITATLPYVVFYATGDDATPGDSMAGTSGAYMTEFQITYVGDSREQAKRAGERARAALDRKRIAFAAGSRFVRRTDDNQYVRRDDTWTRPGGEPLFFGVDRYAVLI